MTALVRERGVQRRAQPHPADSMARQRRWRTPHARTLLLISALVLLVLVVGAGAFRATGGRWMMVTTPSMGPAAPVGTLILTRPVGIRDTRVGDIIAFHPPTEPRETFTHRVVTVEPDGGLRTRGDINGATDPWVVHSTDLIGEVAFRGWGLGWLVKALPVLLLGYLTLWGYTHWYSKPWRRAPARMFGGSLLWSLTAVLLKPFVGMTVVASTVVTGVAQVTVVSTGLLPIRVQAEDGGYVDLANGQLGTVTTSALDGGGAYQLAPSLHLPLTWLLVLGLVCASPLLWCLIVGMPDVDPDSPVDSPETRQDDGGIQPC